MQARLQAEPFSPGAELDALIARSGGAGAVASFTGLVRSTPDEPVTAMTLEHYPALAQKQLDTLLATAIDRFSLRDAALIHRHGRMLPGEPIVLVMALADHRQSALDAVSFMMDTLKTTAPFWKKEERPDGTHWVEAKASDDVAAERWTKGNKR